MPIRKVNALRTFQGTSKQIINELCNSLFDSRTKEYLNFLGLKPTSEGISYPAPLSSLISKKARSWRNFKKSKFENVENLLSLFTKDDCTGMVVPFYPAGDIPASITFLNKEIVHCHGSKVLSLVEYEKVNDINIVKFTDNRDNFFTLFILPHGPVALYVTDYYGDDKCMQVVRPNEYDDSKRLFWCATKESTYIGMFDKTDTGNVFFIRSKEKITDYIAYGEFRDVFLSRVEKTYFKRALVLHREILCKQYIRYITEIFTSPDVVRKLFDGPVESEFINEKSEYYLKDTKIVDGRGVKIIELENKPAKNEKCVRFEIDTFDKNLVPYLKQNIEVSGEIDIETKKVNLSICIPFSNVDKGVDKYYYDFKFFLNKPHELVEERLFIYYNLEYYCNNTGFLSMHTYSQFDDEIERRLFKEFATRFAGVSEGIKENLSTETYSL